MHEGSCLTQRWWRVNDLSHIDSAKVPSCLTRLQNGVWLEVRYLETGVLANTLSVHDGQQTYKLWPGVSTLKTSLNIVSKIRLFWLNGWELEPRLPHSYVAEHERYESHWHGFPKMTPFNESCNRVQAELLKSCWTPWLRAWWLALGWPEIWSCRSWSLRFEARYDMGVSQNEITSHDANQMVW